MHPGIRIITISIFFVFLAGSQKTIAQITVKPSIGISAGGSGLAGIPLQLRPSKFISLDLGIYFRAAHTNVFVDKWFYGPSADIALNLYLSRKENIDKSRLIEHGFYLKGAYGLHKKENDDLLRYSEKMAGIGWLMEISNNNNPHKKMQIQLGPSLIKNHESYLNTRYPPGYQVQNEDYFSGMIYGRICWFFALSK